MDRSHDFALRDEDLLSLVLNDRPLAGEKQAHLEQCVLCQQRLAEIHQVNNALVRRLYRVFCPSSTEIGLYCEDQLTPENRLHIATHVLSCPLCTREVAQTRTFNRERSLEPATTFAPLVGVRRVIALLQRPQLQLVTRGEESSISQKIWSRQYRAEDIDLSLHLISSSKDAYELLGVLSSTDDENSADLFEGAIAVLGRGSSLAAAVPTLFPETGPVMRIQVDDLGNFAFAALAAGEYTLIIHLSDRDVVVEQVAIEQT